jgi:hypothetical protein
MSLPYSVGYRIVCRRDTGVINCCQTRHRASDGTPSTSHGWPLVRAAMEQSVIQPGGIGSALSAVGAAGRMVTVTGTDGSDSMSLVIAVTL